ncbi:actin depolymerizing factor [Phanerochaete sordida]|uniref:Cofilin n=1 Tax=Phanerochaete sordida TaxID=48140 RepID=A0A9P3G5A0_9APHY|nr:actin depolymerizing factor [Phanerochaete sordida]
MTDMAVDADCLADCVKVWKGELKYILCNLNSDNTAIVTVKTSTDANYDNFLAESASDQCLWALYHLQWKNASGVSKTRIVLYTWTPDDAKIKRKLVFSAARGSFQTKLTNSAVTHYALVATESSDLALNNVTAKL